MPLLLAGHAVGLTLAGVVVTAAGIGALFPLASSLHVVASRRTADRAIGQVLVIAAIGQIVGPVTVAVIAQPTSLHVGMLILPAFVLLAAAALVAYLRGPQVRQPSSPFELGI